MGFSISKFHKEKLVMLGVFLLGIFFAIYMFMYFSDAHKSAEAHLLGSGQEIEEIGLPKSVWLLPFPSQISSNGFDGSAEIRFWVQGSEGSTLVSVNLREESGKWKVIQAKAQ